MMSANVLIKDNNASSTFLNLDLPFIEFFNESEETTVDCSNSSQNCSDNTFSSASFRNKNVSSVRIELTPKKRPFQEEVNVAICNKRPTVLEEGKHINTYLLDVFDKHEVNTLT